VGLGGSLIVWGYMGPQRVGYRHMIDGIMDAELHTGIYQAEFLARVVFYGMGRAELIFNHKHTSKKSSEWFQYKDINVMKCHEWSPDLALLNICGNM
jgi:hypothetical protein